VVGKKMRSFVVALGGTLLFLVASACGSAAEHRTTQASEVYMSYRGQYYVRAYDPTLDTLQWFWLSHETRGGMPIVITSAGGVNLSGYTWQPQVAPFEPFLSTEAAIRVDNGQPSDPNQPENYTDVESAAAESILVNADSTIEDVRSDFGG
jgi:hypothetical protein